MSEHEHSTDVATAGHRPAESTGHARVDEVLGTLDRLDELPVDQHVPVLEAAHVALREALSGAVPTGPSVPAAQSQR